MGQKAVMKRLRSLGWHVEDCTRLAMGHPDLRAVRPDGRVFYVECKGKSAALSGAQHRTFASGKFGHVVIVRGDEIPDWLINYSDKSMRGR